MVEVTSGALLTCSDVATQQFVQFLNSQKIIGNHEFILQVLDETHLFVAADKVEAILKEIDAFSDSNAYNNVQSADNGADNGKPSRKKPPVMSSKKK